MSEASPAKGSFYRPELDALRLLAFLMVFGYHTFPIEPGEYGLFQSSFARDMLANFAGSLGSGLQLFFVLSAYLITTLLLREKDRTSGVSVKAFYIRRMLRIWPLYFLAILVSLVAEIVFRGTQQLGYYLSYLFIVGNWTVYWGLTSQSPFTIGHLWSLAVEEQFYLVFPSLAKYGSRTTLYGVSGLLAVGSVLTLAYVTRDHISYDNVWRNGFVEYLMFAAGIALGVWFSDHDLPTLSRAKRLALGLVGYGFCFGAYLFFKIHRADTTGEFLPLTGRFAFVCIGVSCMLVSVLGVEGSPPPSIIYLGKISYGLYVFHAWAFTISTGLIFHLFHASPVNSGGLVLLSKNLLSLPISVALAAVSYRFFEMPFLKLKDRFAVIRSRPV